MLNRGEIVARRVARRCQFARRIITIIDSRSECATHRYLVREEIRTGDFGRSILLPAPINNDNYTNDNDYDVLALIIFRTRTDGASARGD